MSDEAQDEIGKAYDARLLRRLWEFVRPYRGIFWAALLLSPVNQAFSLVQPYLLMVGIDRYVAAHDSGRIVNPRMAENQVSGGVLQFLGIALREEMLIDRRSGVVLNPGFLEHKHTSIVDSPPVEVIFRGEPDRVGPFGAKALGEPPVVPVFAAIANAVANATGARLHEVPFTSARVLAALRAQARSLV